MEKFFELKIEKMTLGGQGLGHRNGKVCFVDRVIPGETVRAEVAAEKRDYIVARALDVVEPSRYRVTPLCPVYNRCGGCQLQHIAHEHQLTVKQDVFADALMHIGKIPVAINGFFFAETWNYRSRTQLPVQLRDRLNIGYFQSGTHKVIDHASCPINHPAINELLPAIRQRIAASGISIYDESSGRGNLRHIVINVGTRTNQRFVTFVTREKNIPLNLYQHLDQAGFAVVGVTQNINPGKTNRVLGPTATTLLGRDYYEEKIGRVKYRISAGTFFQINTGVLAKILPVIEDRLPLSGDETVLDLYAGIGVMSMPLAARVKKVIGVEENPRAILDGLATCATQGVVNLQYLEGRVESLLATVKTADVAIIDPPRRGVEEAVLERVAAIGIRRIVYLSCNPASFARDARRLQSRGYRITETFLFDMFPQTYHIESLCFFEK